MPPRIRKLRVGPFAGDHMEEKHGVAAEEAIEAAEDARTYRRTHGGKGGERRYLAPGKTLGGRRLWVVVVDEGFGRGRIVSAWEPRSKADVSRHRHLSGE
jgi:uncharacterized DUF497 family protein